MNDINKKLSNLSKGQKSKWRENALFRIKNKKWLNYSSNVARRILSAMDEVNLSQKLLAEKIDVSPQYINKVIKGHENLSLETIAKLSEALDVELISFPTYKYNTSLIQLSLINTSFTTFSNIHKTAYTKQTLSHELNAIFLTNIGSSIKALDSEDEKVEENSNLIAA